MPGAEIVSVTKPQNNPELRRIAAFIVVSIGVIILRVREPELPRAFKVPGYPVTPALSVLACGYILISLHWYTWIAFAGWISVALLFYFVWGRHHSALNDPARL